MPFFMIYLIFWIRVYWDDFFCSNTVYDFFIDGVAAKKIIPIHTDPIKNGYNNVQSVNMHDTVSMT